MAAVACDFNFYIFSVSAGGIPISIFISNELIESPEIEFSS